jgi:hypothetical protein
LQHLNVQVTPLFGSDLGYDLNLPQTGSISGASAMPPWIAAQFRLLHGDRRVRKGQKRFAGVTEEMMDGLTNNSAYDTAIDNVENCFGVPLSDGTITFTPVIIHYPSIKFPAIYTPVVISGQFAGWTSQNSRKLGRGS